MEIWKTIENFPDYMVSDQGRVKSFKRYKSGKLLKQWKTKNGYWFVVLYKNKKNYSKIVSRIIIETFNPVNNMEYLECNHIDGNKENNYIKNLEWLSRSGNQKHAFKIGLNSQLGEKNANSKLNDFKVRIIKQILNSPIIKHLKITQKEIGKIFGVKRKTISDIKNEKIWRHIL